MELENVNPVGETNVEANNLIKVNIFLKILKIEFKNKHHMVFFLKDTMIAPNFFFLILSTSEINIE
jgi:hypothetical protein